MIRICSLVFVLLMAMKVNGFDPSKKLQLAVYYESKCPDSKSFIIDELVPTMDLLEDYIDLDLIPFGKAHSVNRSKVMFECQHGVKECTGNMIQSCAIDLMMGRISDLRIAKYVACEMETYASTRGDMTCVRQAGVNVGMVVHCSTNNHGIHLQLQHEKETKRLRPQFIPTITVNGRYNQQTQDMAIQDLALTMCKFLKREVPCTRRFNDFSWEADELD